MISAEVYEWGHKDKYSYAYNIVELFLDEF